LTQLVEVVSELLRERLGPTSEYVSSLIGIQAAYINTNHPDFQAGSAAIARAGPQPEEVKKVSIPYAELTSRNHPTLAHKTMTMKIHHLKLKLDLTIPILVVHLKQPIIPEQHQLLSPTLADQRVQDQERSPKRTPLSKTNDVIFELLADLCLPLLIYSEARPMRSMRWVSKVHHHILPKRHSWITSIGDLMGVVNPVHLPEICKCVLRDQEWGNSNNNKCKVGEEREVVRIQEDRMDRGIEL
jgi:hypothetical protein